jgi:hypothetical protein
MTEARLERLENGLAPVEDGWFVVNVRDAAWIESPAFGSGRARAPARSRCTTRGRRRR